MRSITYFMLLPLVACSAGNAESGDAVVARGSGPVRTFPVSGFTAVELRAADDVDVRVGPGFSVRAEGAPEELDLMEIVRDGDTLKVGRRSGGSRWGGKGVKVFVTMPRLTAAAVDGAGDMTVDRVEGEEFVGAIAGSGSLTVSAIRVEKAELSIAGSGDLTGAGRVRRLEMSIAGSGDIDARQLSAAQAEVSIAGSGNALARVDGPAEVNIVGSGDAELGPGARCEVSKMGSGSARCG